MGEKQKYRQHVFHSYLQMPKEFVGPHGADKLFEMYETIRQNGNSWTYLFAAGSAAAESGIMATHIDTDERHARIDAAKHTWNEAQNRFLFKHLDDSSSEALRYAIPDRIEMHQAFIELYHDLVDSNVRQETMEHLHDRLIQIGIANLELHDEAEQTGDFGGMVHRRGLAYELGTLMTITRLHCPSFFAIPATVRADHGAYYPEQTHDVRLIQQSWGAIRQCIPYEVKPADNRGEYAKHYKSALVRGRVELLMPSSTEPLDIVRFMEAERTGKISTTRLQELNEITSRVLRLAEQYKLRQSLALASLSAVSA